MEKCSNASPDFYTGWRFPKRFRSDMEKKIHRIEKSVFFQYFLVFPRQVFDKETNTLYEGYKKIFC